ncbi:hypothetical protein SAMN02745123_02260 [Desulforamulus aeronauticus DSM 10349]|uniref:Hook-length control protein FliK n=2 Tax=Desulforamulus aeronauticus TaxID=53343 RepID=A0A1M6TCK4_9FIRM|nr:hypothetical protein SAMN02745123_02260 [Desulforamulus aeronauticus DSM 10349]
MEMKPMNITSNKVPDMINKPTENGEAEKLSWPKGEVRQAIILEQLSESRYLARVGGKEICIQCFDSLPLNAKVTLELQGNLEDIFLVKPVISDTLEAVDQEELMQRLLTQLQMKDTPLHRNLIQGFLNQEIPLKSLSLQLAEKIVQKLGGDTPENIEKALLGMKLGMPPEPLLLNAVHAFLCDITSFQQGNEAKLQLFINKLVAILTDAGTAEPGQISGSVSEAQPLSALLSKEGYELLQKIQEYLKNISLEPEQGLTKTAEQLKNLLSSQLTGLTYETGMKSSNNSKVLNTNVASPSPVNLFEANMTSLTNKVTGEAGSQSPIINSKESVMTASDELITSDVGQLRKTTGEESTKQVLKELTSLADPKQSLTQTTGLDQKVPDSKFNHRDAATLLQIFSKLIENIKQAAKETGESVQVKNLVQEGTALEKQLVGQQVFQTLNRTEGQQNILYFNLPFIKQEDSQTWGQLKIIKDNTQRQDIDPKHLSMALLLNTLSMGPLLLELKVRNKEIMAGGKVTEEWVANSLRTAWPKLQEAFVKMGYQLHTCAWQVGSFTTNLLPTGLKKDDTDCSLQTVDITI